MVCSGSSEWFGGVLLSGSSGWFGVVFGVFWSVLWFF